MNSRETAKLFAANILMEPPGEHDAGLVALASDYLDVVQKLEKSEGPPPEPAMILSCVTRGDVSQAVDRVERAHGRLSNRKSPQGDGDAAFMNGVTAACALVQEAVRQVRGFAMSHDEIMDRVGAPR